MGGVDSLSLAAIETCTRTGWHADQRESALLAGVFAGESWRITGVVMTVAWADGNKDLMTLASS